MVPISTTQWDPKWYHNFGSNDNVFVDNNGVINGIRYEPLNPMYNHAFGCPCKYHKVGLESNCKFLIDYRNGIRRLDFEKVMSDLQNISDEVIDYWRSVDLNVAEPTLVLIVYETPDNPCSERVELIKLFSDHGIDLEEV